MDQGHDALLAEARAWLAADTDPVTRAELAELVDREDVEALKERFGAPLEFGTAGLRGLVGAGPSRMNRLVVERTTRALAEYLRAREPDARVLPVVVGHDARPTSRAFAEIVVRVLTAAQIPVRYFTEACPTPLVAYAARELGAQAAVVVTASHNPAAYNGYKLYGRDAVQIVPPVDAEIERRVRALPHEAVRAGDGLRDGVPLAAALPASMVERYLARLDADRPHGPSVRSIGIVYTPLHGVGGALATRALAAAGFTDVVQVPEQAEPDGTFPTVHSPNPEEPEAMARALSLAGERRADLVLANDPDADRLAVAVSTAASRFRALTGNQIGVLLGDFVLSEVRAPRGLVVSTIVSSPMLRDIAESHGARYEVTLTGFKWIWSCALALERREGLKFVFGYEEAIGFSVGDAVRDKDGISAAVWFAELAARCRSENQSVLERLAALYRRHGLWASAQHSIARSGEDGARAIASAVDKVVAEPPQTLAGRKVVRVVDYRAGFDRRPAWLGAAPVVEVDLGAEGRALLRPSGTEPKLKIYADLRRNLGPGEAVWPAEEALGREAATVVRELARLAGFDE